MATPRRTPALDSLAQIRASAQAKCQGLAATRAGVAAKLGGLALAWHADRTPERLCAVACGVLSPAHKVDTPAATPADLLDAVAQHEAELAAVLSPSGCGVPSLLTRSWPVLALYPIVSYAVSYYLLQHWTDLTAQVHAASDALRGLLVNWVWEPSMRLLQTLRAGRAERRMLVSRDSLAADERSLERMVTAFARDQLNLDGAALDEVPARVRRGDLTSIMETYESDIRSPLRSLLGGSLIRTVLIQVQKAKVDLEVALNGIDWLLRSQELLIGLTSIAPALVILYVLGRQALRGAQYTMYGAPAYTARMNARTLRITAWEALRRIDRLCAGGVDAHGAAAADASSAARHYGQLLLDIALLRAAFGDLVLASCRADHALAARLVEQFRIDMDELEVAGRGAVVGAHASAEAWSLRQASVERMWRSWGTMLTLDV